MLKKTALVALMSGILAAPLAWAQEDFDNEVDASDAAEFSDETAADESFDEQAEPDESTGMADAEDSADEDFAAEGADESAADVQEAEEPTDDVAAGLEDEGNPADEPGSDADSEEVASDLIDDTSTADAAGDPEAPDAQGDTRPANAATSPAAETPAAVTRDDARGISITLKHSGAYIARYEISYSEAGEEKKIEAREKTKGWTQTFVVPAGGTNIRLQAWAMTGLVWQPWGEIYNMVLQPRTDYCYENTGTTLGRAFNPC